MSSARVQKLNALLSRVQERRVQPRLLNVPSAEARAPSPAHAAPARVDARVQSMAPTPEPLAPAPSAPPMVAPAATLPPAGRAPSMRPEEAPRRPASPLEDAMAQFGANREDSGPLMVESLSSPIHTIDRPSEPVNQDLLLTHRPEAGSLPPGPIVELVQPKHHPREPTLQFETAVRPNPPTQRDLKPAGLAEPPREAVRFEPAPQAPLSAPTQRLEPAIPTQATPVRIVSSARQEAPKTFGELLEASLSLRPNGR